MLKLLFIMIGGALGALLRYGMSGIVYRYINGVFPWGTLGVNLIGCFFIGFLWHLLDTLIISSNVRAFIFVGVLGAFTTFSTYGLETLNLLRENELNLAFSNIVLSNLVGIILVFAGFIFARLFAGIFR